MKKEKSFQIWSKETSKLIFKDEKGTPFTKKEAEEFIKGDPGKYRIDEVSNTGVDNWYKPNKSKAA